MLDSTWHKDSSNGRNLRCSLLFSLAAQKSRKSLTESYRGGVAYRYLIHGGMKMKKISVLLLAVMMLFAFTACDDNPNDEGSKIPMDTLKTLFKEVV